MKEIGILVLFVFKSFCFCVPFLSQKDGKDAIFGECNFRVSLCGSVLWYDVLDV